MRMDDVERDLKIIRQAIEASSRYTNITARGYFFSGIVAVIGTWKTYTFLGPEKTVNMGLITSDDLKILTIIWTLVLLVSLAIAIFFSWWKARKNRMSAWNSLTARMFLSQIPLIAMAGMLTLGMAFKGYYNVIPAIWLGAYGVIFYSFSYFTGIGHKIEGLLFIILGTIALFASGPVSILCLGLGFGGIHIASALVRWAARWKGQHESE